MAISLCAITKDEEEFLSDFLEHHKSLVDEVIVVDTGSSDKSIRVAKHFTDKVYIYDWNDDFSSARNFSVSKASSDWILWLDPDERIDVKDFDRIKELTNKDLPGYSFLQRNYTNVRAHPRFEALDDDREKNKGFSGYFVRRICKLFRKGIKFEYPVHETVKNSIEKIEKTGIVIEHKPEVKDKNRLIEKSKGYLKLLEKKKREFPSSNAEKEIESEKIILDYYNKI